MEKAELIIVIFKFFVFLSISAAFFNNKVCVGKKLLTCPKFISRTEWKARKSYGSEPLIYIPTPYVVVHHGGIDQHCFNESSCSHIVKSYQNLHMDKNHWNDIGYNFLVGEDGNVYEGRGWDSVGAHAPGYNTQSIGVCMIGNFNNALPNRPALKALKSFIKCGVGFGKIAKDYFLIGHTQTRTTICPGQALYEYVKHQLHWIKISFIRRSEWGATKQRDDVNPLKIKPPTHVIIHHAVTDTCTTRAVCQAKIRAFQNYHMNDKKWKDIGYNFIIGEDGNIYEGRGWGKIGAHTIDYNNRSIGICIIGTYQNRIPNIVAIKAIKN